jgi:hypothetical protein
MTYTARELITNAYYLTGIVSKSLQTVSGEQISDGLDLLNELLAVKGIHMRLIPYFREYSLTAVVGQEKYFIPHLLDIETFTFYIGSIRFSTNKQQRKRYRGSPRVDTIQALPYNWNFERSLGGGDLSIYFLPNTTYPLKIWGKFGFDEVTTVDVDLALSYDKFYLTYLRYALAEYICSDYNITFQPQNAEKLKELESLMVDVSPKDFSMVKGSTLNGPNANIGIYGQANIGGGWIP